MLLVATSGYPQWLLTPWFHAANLGLGLAGIWFFHPITNFMRDYWDHEDTNR